MVDDTYYERAWCCVEAKMISELTEEGRLPWQRAQPAHRWYEHMLASDPCGDGGQKWILRPARRERISMRKKKLTYERDRPKVMFLDRQSRLLGKVNLFYEGPTECNWWPNNNFVL
jgi:hypothetical protein